VFKLLLRFAAGWVSAGVALAGVVVFCPHIQAQAAAAGPASFEVASIRPHENAEDPSETNFLPGGRYEGKNVSVRKMIRQALGVEDTQMSGAPDWVDTARYDIEAKTGEAATLRPEEFQKLLLALLEERFQLKFHRETRERPVYWLVVQKGEAKLKQHTGDSEPTMSVNGSPTRKMLAAAGISMGDLAGLLRRQAGRPVVDHTGLNGSYDVKLEWDESQAVDSALPSLFGAIEDQLGLKLNPAKGNVEVVVIDHVGKPSDN